MSTLVGYLLCFDVVVRGRPALPKTACWIGQHMSGNLVSSDPACFKLVLIYVEFELLQSERNLDTCGSDIDNPWPGFHRNGKVVGKLQRNCPKEIQPAGMSSPRLVHVLCARVFGDVCRVQAPVHKACIYS